MCLKLEMWDRGDNLGTVRDCWCVEESSDHILECKKSWKKLRRAVQKNGW